MVTEFDGDTAYADAVTGRREQHRRSAGRARVGAIGDRSARPRQRLRDNGIPVLEGFRSGLAALGHLARWPLPVDAARPEPRVLSNVEFPKAPSAFELLSAYGVPVVQIADLPIRLARRWRRPTRSAIRSR